MTTVKGILFDKDGTLLDFNRTWIPPYRAAADYLHGRFGDVAHAGKLLLEGGFDPVSESWQTDSLLASGSNLQILAFWTELIGEPIEGDDLAAIESIFSLSGDDYVPVFGGIPSLLSQFLDAGLKLGLATMDDEANAWHALEALQATSSFEFVCGADSGHGVKPEPGMVHAFCRQCGLREDEVIMVGDSPKDLNMGRNAGVALSVGVLTGAHDEDELAPHADMVMKDISDLISLL